MKVRGTLLALLMLIMTGCAAIPYTAGNSGNLPPVMTLDELNQPYSKIGRIQVTRTVYFSDYAAPPQLHEWATQALREEAGKLNADAVILPEVTSKQLDIVVFPAFPATEYRATAVAIRFDDRRSTHR